MNNFEEFEKKKEESIEKMRKDKKIHSLASDFYEFFSNYNYQYNFNWLGVPIIQIPQDIITMQEIIWETKPDLIIETGIARGGSLIFYSSLLELIGKGRVLGIDIDIRKHNREKIEKHPMFKRIKMIEGSSIDEKVIRQVEEIAKKNNTIMVCLDSLHTHDHVLEELRLYSRFVSKNSYLVVFDTIVDYMPEKFSQDKPWSKGNSPATAVKQFLKDNKSFVVEKRFEDKMLITAAPGGYLKRIN